MSVALVAAPLRVETAVVASAHDDAPAETSSPLPQDERRDAAPRSAHDDTALWAGVATAIGAGVVLASALGLHALAEGRAQAYRASPCNGSHTVLSADCGSILSDYQVMFPLAIALDVVAALAAVTSAVLFGLDAGASHDTAALACSPSGVGFMCRWL